jgi:hypothetical protein
MYLGNAMNLGRGSPCDKNNTEQHPPAPRAHGRATPMAAWTHDDAMALVGQPGGGGNIAQKNSSVEHEYAVRLDYGVPIFTPYRCFGARTYP